VKTQKFFVPGPLPGMNEIIAARGYRARGGGRYERMKKLWNHTVAIHAKAAKIKPVGNYCFLTFTWIEKDKRRDKDNIAAGKKLVIDGLVEAGILNNDGWSDISGFDDHWDVDVKRPGVYVEIKG